MTITERRFVFAGCKPWHREAFAEIQRRVPGEWRLATCKEDLDVEAIVAWQPRAVFFLHWSWKVPKTLTDAIDCICFHVGRLPDERGGSPVQNLIARGVRQSSLNALRMVDEIDAGPIYASWPVSLEGGGEEIFLRLTRTSLAMIEWMVDNRPTPIAQPAEGHVMKRRTPADSLLVGNQSDLGAVHDFVRMLDADGYPKAFVEVGNLRLEFSRSALYHDHVQADARITLKTSEDL